MTDMMFKDEIQELVRDAYGRIEPPDGAGARFYQEDQLARVPPTARRWSLGVGNPLLWADLHPGEKVVDLGSGAGIDVFLAAARVGPTGAAVGIDLLDSMVERSRDAAEEAGVENVEFIRSEMGISPWTTNRWMWSYPTDRSISPPARAGCWRRRFGFCDRGEGYVSPT